MVKKGNCHWNEPKKRTRSKGPPGTTLASGEWRKKGKDRQEKKAKFPNNEERLKRIELQAANTGGLPIQKEKPAK